MSGAWKNRRAGAEWNTLFGKSVMARSSIPCQHPVAANSQTNRTRQSSWASRRMPRNSACRSRSNPNVGCQDNSCPRVPARRAGPMSRSRCGRKLSRNAPAHVAKGQCTLPEYCSAGPRDTGRGGFILCNKRRNKGSPNHATWATRKST